MDILYYNIHFCQVNKVNFRRTFTKSVPPWTQNSARDKSNADGINRPHTYQFSSFDNVSKKSFGVIAGTAECR